MTAMCALTQSRLANAIALAAEKHKNQFDKQGMPYILHPLKVMHYLKTDDLELMIIAVFHDLFEDTDITAEYLRAQGYSMRIIDAVTALTKVKHQTEENYLAAIKANKDAVRVKLCDLRHNMDARRLKEISPKASARMDKYCKMYWELKDLI